MNKEQRKFKRVVKDRKIKKAFNKSRRFFEDGTLTPPKSKKYKIRKK
jgi:hypothetical protein